MRSPISFIPYSACATFLLRIIIGAVFLISGITKAFDPWGFIFKLEEYLMAWGIEQPRSILLIVAILLSAYEFICGLMLMLGAFRRTMPMLLMLSMGIMLPLTAYIAIANPISDCGCFGDFIHLSNTSTFLKNLVIVVSLTYLIRYNKQLKAIAIKPALQWIAVVASFIYVIVVALIGYMVQPLVDFRPYPIGSQVVSDNDTSDSDNIIFTYQKGDVTQDFSIDALPDSTWTFVSRSTPQSEDIDTNGSLIVFDGDEDVTQEVLTTDGLLLLITLPEPDIIDIAYAYNANVLAKAVSDRGGSTIGLLATDQAGIDQWVDMSMAQYPCYTSDDTTLKALVRGTIGIVLIKDNTIVWKRSISPIDYQKLESLSNSAVELESLAVNENILTTLTLSLIAILLLISILPHLFGVHNLLFKKKDVTLHHNSEK